MPTTRITDADIEPLTVAVAKRHLRVDDVDTDVDTDIGACIKAARMDAEHRLQRTLITTTWEHTRDAFPGCDEGHLIRLPMGAVLAITSVKYVDEAGTLQTMDAADYQLSADRLAPAYNTTWPATRCELGAVRVRYTAGYSASASDVPAPIVSWIKLAVADLWDQRSRSAERPAVPQHFADSLLDAYRIWAL
jgi:uncharacterized phiE125 gp8 family phage protein